MGYLKGLITLRPPAVWEVYNFINLLQLPLTLPPPISRLSQGKKEVGLSSQLNHGQLTQWCIFLRCDTCAVCQIFNYFKENMSL